ncbi:MAG: DUF1275 family protein, partial [Lacisediminihabitans sp.]
MKNRLRQHPAGLHLGLMLALTFSTGAVDSVGYLGLDRVFTGNMTGNVVILAMALTGAGGLPIIGPVIALLCFLIGATISGRVLRDQAAGWSTWSTLLFITVGLVIASAAILAFALAAPRPGAVTFAITGALGLAMGMQGGAARQIG